MEGKFSLEDWRNRSLNLSRSHQLQGLNNDGRRDFIEPLIITPLPIISHGLKILRKDK